jgi:hypothetical protein
MKLCTPSKIYFFLAIILLFLSFVNDMQNKDKDKVCLGKLKCKNKPLYYLMNVLFIVLWSWVLNKLCSYGWVKLSWFLLVAPFFILLVLFIMISYMVVRMAKNMNQANASVSGGMGMGMGMGMGTGMQRMQ